MDDYTEIDESVPEEVAASTKRNNLNFVTDVMKLVTGTVFAQVLAVIIAPILTRLFSPEHFGIAANFSSIVAILGVIACLRYELSIMLPKTNEQAANQFAISLLFSLLFSLATIPLIWFGGEEFLALINVPELQPYLWMLPIGIFAAGSFLALNYWNSRTRKYLRLSLARISQESVMAASKLGLGFAGFNNAGSLIIGNIAGPVIATLTLGLQIWRDDKTFLFKSIHWAEMREGIKRYEKFPKFSTSAALLNTVAQQIPVILLTAFFSTTVTGLYSMGYRIIRLPMVLVGSSIAQVFFQRAAAAKEEGPKELRKLVEEVFDRLVIFSLFPMLLISLVGQELFIIVFGAEWAEAGVYMQILAIWTFFVFISSPISQLMSLLEKQEVGIYFNVALLVTRFGSIAIGAYFSDVRLGLWLFSITGSLLYGWLCLWLTGTAGIPAGRILKILSRHIAYSLPFLLVLAAAKWGLHASAVVVLLVSVLASVVYYLLAFLRDKTLIDTVRPIINRFKG
jgi:O-antigen/teichoic acid export membrane protein